MPKQYPLAAAVVALSLAPLALTGCTGVSAATRTNAYVMASGNWQFSSNAPQAVGLSTLSGEIATAGASTSNAAHSDQSRLAVSASAGTITGILHAQGTSTCVAPTASFEVSGSADSSGNLTLTGPLAGGTLSITGTLASDGKSLSNATYNVTGGTCAFAKAALATAQAYTPISGNYDGTFTDADGIVATVTATLNQSADSNGDGNYTLTGSAALPNNPCFSTATLTLSATEVTGGTFTFTFADPVTNATVTASGTFSPDASTLSVGQWTLTNCSTDTGTGTLTRQ